MVRDWQMGFVSWNCRFKTAVNLSRTLWSYETVKQEEPAYSYTDSEVQVDEPASPTVEREESR